MEIFSSYTGADFLLFYMLLIVASVVASFWIPANLRLPGRSRSTLEAEEMALLIGGPLCHALVVATDLLVQGGLKNASSGKLIVAKEKVERSGSAGRAVLRKLGAFDIRELCFTTAVDADAIRSRLEGWGLLLTQSDFRRLQWQTVAPFLAILVIGFYRAWAGYREGEAIGFLVGLMIVSAAIAIYRYSSLHRRTQAGEKLVREEITRSKRLSLAPEGYEASFAVALFGPAVLIGTPWDAVHAMKPSAIASSGGGGGYAGCGNSNSAGDGGGSGCGGGGCGGCGG